jgi:hypothetical protein
MRLGRPRVICARCGRTAPLLLPLCRPRPTLAACLLENQQTVVRQQVELIDFLEEIRRAERILKGADGRCLTYRRADEARYA